MGSNVGAGQCRSCHNTGRAIKRDDFGDIIKCTACPPPCEHTSWHGFRNVDRSICMNCGALKFQQGECTSKIGHVYSKKKAHVWACKRCTKEIFMPVCPKCQKAILPKYAEKGIKACVTDCTKQEKKPEPKKDDSPLLWNPDPPEDILTPDQSKTQVQAYKLTGNSGENVEVLYTGNFHKGFDERCQNYATAAECWVRYNFGIEVKYFSPKGESDETSPA